MSMKGIDIASYQAKMDVRKTDAQFVIIKATQGTTYKNPYFSAHYAQAKEAGKLLAAYHYCTGAGAEKEADFFLSVVGSRAGECVLALDWEYNKGGGENSMYNKSGEVEYVRKMAARIHEKTGTWPLIYMSASVTRRRDWSPVAENCPLWMAQYGSTKLTGWQTAPWTDGKACGAWGRNIAIHQYSPSGNISGWHPGREHQLDMDIAYITAEEWKALASGGKGSGTASGSAAPATGSKVTASVFPDKTNQELAVEVLFNVHGSGAARRQALGDRYDAVQKIVTAYCDDFPAFLEAAKAYFKKHGHTAISNANR